MRKPGASFARIFRLERPDPRVARLDQRSQGDEDVPELEEVGLAHEAALDPLAVQVTAVARAGVLQIPAERGAGEPGMQARQRRGGEHQGQAPHAASVGDDRGAVVTSADVDLAHPIEREPRAAGERPIPFEHHEEVRLGDDAHLASVAEVVLDGVGRVLRHVPGIFNTGRRCYS